MYKTSMQIVLCILFLSFCNIQAQNNPRFKVLSIYTAKNDLAHISFWNESNYWFPAMAERYNFLYETTTWDSLNPDTLSNYQVIIFLDTRPDQDPIHRSAFQAYMEKGGAWMGFHFAGFALQNSQYPQNWPWYHNHFLGAGQYNGNTWRPTSAVLRVERPDHPATKNTPRVFKSAPNEWYKWQYDLRGNSDIEILLSIDPASFPLGTGPKPHEIWYSGYYPVVWTNKNYRMIYMNMGHNDMDYEHKYNNNTVITLSYTFANEIQNKLVLDSLLWLGNSEQEADLRRFAGKTEDQVEEKQSSEFGKSWILLTSIFGLGSLVVVVVILRWKSRPRREILETAF